MKLRILHLEDDQQDVELIRRALTRHGLECDILAVASERDYLAALVREPFDAILSDSGLPGYDGSEARRAASRLRPDVPFIVVSGDPDTADRSASAIVAKHKLGELGPVVERIITRAGEAATEASAESSTAYVQGMEHLVGVVQRLSLARNLDTILSIVRRAARELTGADGATFVLREGERCHYVDEDAIGPLWKGQRFPLTACISGWTMLNRQAAAIEDIFQDPRIPHDAYRATFVKSLVMVPIRTLAPVGAIGTYWAAPHKASAAEVKLLQALADSTSIAMEAVGLFTNLENRVAERTAELHRRSRELELLNGELDAFSSSVAHDLRAPLRAIQALNDDLLATHDERSGAEIRGDLERISANATRMHSIIDDLLALAKIVRAPLTRGPVDLAEIGRKVIAELRQHEPDRRGDAVIEPGLIAQADAGLMRIILENLLANAWKFSSRQDTYRIELGARADRSRGTLYFVRDNGAGFDPRHAEKLFAPFQRLHTQTEFPGTGIGLATVQRAVQRHGGKIWAESQPGCGATFYFTLS